MYPSVHFIRKFSSSFCGDFGCVIWNFRLLVLFLSRGSWRKLGKKGGTHYAQPLVELYTYTCCNSNVSALQTHYT